MMAFWQGNRPQSNNGRPVLTGNLFLTEDWSKFVCFSFIFVFFLSWTDIYMTRELQWLKIWCFFFYILKRKYKIPAVCLWLIRVGMFQCINSALQFQDLCMYDNIPLGWRYSRRWAYNVIHSLETSYSYG